MHAHEHVVVAVAGCRRDQRDVLDVVVDARVADGPELAVPVGHARLGDAARSSFSCWRRYAIRSAIEISGRPCSSAKTRSSAAAPSRRRRSADDLAERAGRAQAGQPGQVDGGLGVAGPPQHAAVAGAQREDVAGPGEVVGDGRRIGEQTRIVVRAVGGRDAGATPSRASTETV